MNKLNLQSVLFASAVILPANIAIAADTGSCGPNCVYNYDPATQTLTYTGTGENGSGEIGYTSMDYNLSGPVKNAIISEGITRVYRGSNASTIRNIGTQDGKLVIPSTIQNFEWASSYLLGFGTVEINSKNLNLDKNSFLFKSDVNANIILSAEAEITVDDNAFVGTEAYAPLRYPSSLHISCKGDPNTCLSKFGHSLDNMTGSITTGYYEERDENGNLTLKYTDTGYEKYDGNGNVIEEWGPNGKSTYKYDSGGNVVAKFGPNGERLYGKKIYTVEEAEKATAKGDRFHVSLTYK